MDTKTQSATIHNFSSTLGIGGVELLDINCDGDYVRERKDSLMKHINRALISARGLMSMNDYKPLAQPYQFTRYKHSISLEIDAIQTNDEFIQAHADEIVNALANECDLFMGKTH